MVDRQEIRRGLSQMVFYVVDPLLPSRLFLVVLLLLACLGTPRLARELLGLHQGWKLSRRKPGEHFLRRFVTRFPTYLGLPGSPRRGPSSTGSTWWTRSSLYIIIVSTGCRKKNWRKSGSSWTSSYPRAGSVRRRASTLIPFSSRGRRMGPSECAWTTGG